MADTVVSYVLNVNTQNAQKGLDRTGKEAEDAAQDFNKLSSSTEHLAQSTDRLERSQKRAALSARNFRKAGRDLDGAFGDLAQGLSLVNPQLGSMFQTLSDGASIADGLGRGLMGVLSPAFFIVAGAAAAFAGAMYLLHQEEKEAQERAEALKKAIDDTNKVIEQQQRILAGTAQAFQGYIQDVNDTSNQLALLTGSISQYAYESSKATLAAEQFRQEAGGTFKEEKAALKESINARTEQAQKIREQVAALKEQRRIEQSLSERVAGQAPKFTEMTQEEKALRAQLATQEELIAKERQRQESLKGQLLLIDAQANKIEANLEQIANLREEDRKRAEQEKRNAAYRSQQAKKQAELDKAAAKQKAEDAKRAQELLNAQNTLEGLIYTITFQQATQRQKITLNLEKQLQKLKELEAAGASLEDIAKAEQLLREQAANELEEITKKEREITKEKREQVAEEKKKTEEKEKQAKLDKISAGISAGTTVATGDIGSMIGLINPIAGQIASSLIAVGEKTPAERKEELLAQVEALRLGLSYLPEIFLSVIPQVAAALTEAIIDGVQLFFKNLVDLIKSIFTGDRGTRQERRSARRSFISDFFDPEKSATFQGGGRFLASAMGGIRYTGEARQGLAMLHQGEYVVPRTGQAPQEVQRNLSGNSAGININISSIITEQNAIDKLVREIEKRFNSRYGVSQSNLFGGR